MPHTFSYLRVWPEGDFVRVARDRYYTDGTPRRPHPEHLEVVGGKLRWARHPEGGKTASVPTALFAELLPSLAV